MGGDTGVVWKNSPLSAYLQAVGDGDFGEETTVLERQVQDGRRRTTLQSDIVAEEDFDDGAASARDPGHANGTGSVNSNRDDDASQEQLLSLLRLYQVRMCRAIIESPHLHDEDVMFIIQFNPKIVEAFALGETCAETQGPCQTEPNESIPVKEALSFQLPQQLLRWGGPSWSTVATSLVAGIATGCFLRHRFWPQAGSMLAKVAVASGITASICYVLRATCTMGGKLPRCHGLRLNSLVSPAERQRVWSESTETEPQTSASQYLNGYLDSLKELLAERKKFVVLGHTAYSTLQQVELLNRGYGIAHTLSHATHMDGDGNHADLQQHAQEGSSSKLPSTNAKSCVHLRQSLHSFLYSSLLQTRSLLLTSMRTCPLHPAMDDGDWLVNYSLSALGVHQLPPKQQTGDGCAESGPSSSLSLSQLKHLFDLEVLHFSEFLRWMVLFLSPQAFGDRVTSTDAFHAHAPNGEALKKTVAILKQLHVGLELVLHIERLWWLPEQGSSRQVMDTDTSNTSKETNESKLDENAEAIAHSLRLAHKEYELALIRDDAPTIQNAYTAYAKVIADGSLCAGTLSAAIKQLHDTVQGVFLHDREFNHRRKDKAEAILKQLQAKTSALGEILCTLQNHVDAWDWKEMRSQLLNNDGRGDPNISHGDKTHLLDGEGSQAASQGHNRIDGAEAEPIDPAEIARRKHLPIELYEGEKSHKRKGTEEDYFADSDDDSDEEEEARMARWRAGREARLKQYEEEKLREERKKDEKRSAKMFLSELHAVLENLPQREEISVNATQPLANDVAHQPHSNTAFDSDDS